MEDLLRSCERHGDLNTEADCPLCQVRLTSLTLLRRHLGKHQEELSLFALPLSLKDNEKDSDDESHSSPTSNEGEDTVIDAETVGLRACFCNRVNLLPLPDLGKIKLLKGQIRYEGFDAQLLWQINFAEIQNCCEFTYRTIEISGRVAMHAKGYRAPGIENVDWILIEFLSSKDKQMAWSYINANLAEHHDEDTVTKMTSTNTFAAERSFASVNIQGLTYYEEISHVKFEITSMVLSEVGSPRYWHILGSDIEDCVIAGMSVKITILMHFEKGNAIPGRKILWVTPLDFAELIRIEFYTRVISLGRKKSSSDLPIPDIMSPSFQDTSSQTAPRRETASSEGDFQKLPGSQNDTTKQESGYESESIGINPAFLAAATDPQNLLSTTQIHVLARELTTTQIGGTFKFFRTLFTFTQSASEKIWYFLRIFKVEMREYDTVFLKASVYTLDSPLRQEIEMLMRFDSAEQGRVALQFFKAYMESASSVPFRTVS